MLRRTPLTRPVKASSPHRAGQADGFIHRRHIRHTVKIEQLIRAHAQNLADGLLNFLFTLKELVDAPVERDAVLQRAVNELRYKSAVATRRFACARRLSSARDA